MKCIVLGGSGHLGAAFVHELVEGGHDVVATGQKPNPPQSLAGLNVRYLPLPNSAPDFAEQIEGYDLIVDAAAPYAFETQNQQLVKVSLNRGEAVLSAAKKGALIHVGSFTSLLRAPNAAAKAARCAHLYFDLKAKLQQQVIDAEQASVIINPTQCLGPWDNKPLKYALLPLAARGEIPITSNHSINVIDVRDVARLGVSAWNAQIYNQPLLLVGHNTTVDSLVRLVAEKTKAKEPRIQGSATLGAAVAVVWERLAPLLPEKARYPSLGLLLLLQQQWLYPDTHQRSLQLSLHSLSLTVKDALSWYRECGTIED